jgi:peptide/nickel transport system substrate-binding protein
MLEISLTHRLALCAALIGLAACAPAGPGATRAERPGPAAAPASAAPKTLIIAQLNSIRGYGPWSFSSTPGGGASLVEVHTVGLVSEDMHGNLAPRVAAALPSIDDGSIAMLPDGRMQVTWKLRPDVKWHNGMPFTADDVVLGWEVARNPETISSAEQSIRRAESVDAIDPQTVRFLWPNAFYRALDMGHRDLWPYPRALIGEAFRGDKQAFLALPYFSTEYVHLGPFRLVDFGLGETQVFERFDDYFLGRPRVSTIVLRTISDPNTMLANFRAGAIDVITEKALSADLSVELRDELNSARTGMLLERQDNWLRLGLQFDPRWADPPELSRDVRLRRGLLQAIDRDALRQFMLPGFGDTSGDTFMRASDPRVRIVGAPFASHTFDPTRAVQLMVEAGWRRSADGRMLNADGVPVQLELRAMPSYDKETAIVADYWRRVGVDPTEQVLSPTLNRDSEYRARSPAFETADRGNGDGILVAFDGRLHSLPENRWQGANVTHYANARVDGLIDQLYGTIDTDRQGQMLKEIGQVLAEDLPVLPLYFRTSFAAVRTGVRAMVDDYRGTRGSGAPARHAHLWDRD